MKFLTVIASTLLFVLISQQYTTALPIDEEMLEMTTSTFDVEHEKKNVIDMTTERSMTASKRGDEDHEHEHEHEHEVTEAPTEEDKREEHPFTEAPLKKDKRGSPAQQQQQRFPHPEQKDSEEKREVEDSLEVTTPEDDGDKKKRAKSLKSTEEEHVEEEKPKKIEESTVEIPKKVEEPTEEKPKESEFCPEGYAKFEESCLFVGKKTKPLARSAKVSSGSTDSNLVESFPVSDDGSCPPGTEHTERGVCQKVLSQSEMKLKKTGQSCPENSRLVDGQCIFHSFDMSFSTMEMPLATSEQMEVHHEHEMSTATEKKPLIESEFETTMQSVVKS